MSQQKPKHNWSIFYVASSLRIKTNLHFISANFRAFIIEFEDGRIKFVSNNC